MTNDYMLKTLPEFRSRMAQARHNIEPTDYSWYAYDILSNVVFISRLLESSGLTLDEIVGGSSVLDIGCADGDLSFFLESLGYSVTSVDNAPTNANGMRAIRALRQELRSNIKIEEADIDQVSIPRGDTSYGLAVFLGILYHLKNPYRALECLRDCGRYCIVSSKVARYASVGGIQIEGLPLAYLLDAGEANNDPTNYWIFSNSGLKRVIHRSGWHIRAYFNAGNSDRSDPVTPGGDERAFCLLERA